MSERSVNVAARRRLVWLIRGKIIYMYYNTSEVRMLDNITHAVLP